MFQVKEPCLSCDCEQPWPLDGAGGALAPGGKPGRGSGRGLTGLLEAGAPPAPCSLSAPQGQEGSGAGCLPSSSGTAGGCPATGELSDGCQSSRHQCMSPSPPPPSPSGMPASSLFLSSMEKCQAQPEENNNSRKASRPASERAMGWEALLHSSGPLSYQARPGNWRAKGLPHPHLTMGVWRAPLWVNVLGHAPPSGPLPH